MSRIKKLGAIKIIGVDMSTKMLEIAQKENKDKNIKYINLPMEDLDQLSMKPDIVFSSLAFHYVKDYKTLVLKIYNLLNEKGILIFSQENPFNSSYHDDKGPRWEKDEKVSK